MANIFRREPINYGDLNVWGPKELAQNRLAIGLCTANIYLDGATVKLTVGKIGLDNDSTIGVCEIDTVTTVSIAALTASRWAKVEVSVSGTTVTIAATSIGTATAAAMIPTDFTGAYDGSKGGHYITATKRCIALIWINAAGACEGIVNAIGGLDAYEGYSTSDDAVDIVYYFGKNVQARKPAKIVKTLTGSVTLPDLQEDTELVLNIPGGYTATLPTLADNIGRVITIRKTDNNAWWGDVDGEGAETINGEAHYYLRRQYDFIQILGVATGWQIINDNAPRVIDSGIISRSDWTNVHFGTCNIVHTDDLGGTLTAANIIGKKVTGGTTGTYGWVTDYAAGSKTIYLRNVYGTDVRVFDASENLHVTDVDGTTLDTLSFAAADWKNQDSDIWHAFGLNVFRIKVRLFCYVASITTALADAGARELLYGIAEAGANTLGYSLFHIDTNSLQLQGASSGVSTIAADGSRSVFTTEDYAYRLTVEAV